MLHALPAGQFLAAQVVWFEGWKFTGNFTAIDLIAASTNALNGALLARRPDHFKQFTLVGILLMALFGGLGGGITRDVLVAEVPSALTNPAYISLALGFGVLGYLVAFAPGQLFREGWFRLFTAFALPWYAIVGAQKGVDVGLPVLGSLLLAVVGPTAGRFYIDLTSGLAPKQFVRSEWFVTDALLTGLIWIVVFWAGANTWWAAGIAFAFGFTFRLLATYHKWEEPMPREPAGVYQHEDDHPLFGRKLAGKSEGELRDLGLVPDGGPGERAGQLH